MFSEMDSNTPAKGSLNRSTFSPVKLSTPLPDKSSSASTIQQKAIQLVSTIYCDYLKWTMAHSRGKTLCTQIENIKKTAFDKNEMALTTLYPDEMSGPSTKLAAVTGIMGDILGNTRTSLNQLKSLSKVDQSILKTWSLMDCERIVCDLLDAYENEFKVKEMVTSNIAHATSKEEAMVHTAVWEFGIYVNDAIRFKMIQLKQECGIVDNRS